MISEGMPTLKLNSHFKRHDAARPVTVRQKRMRCVHIQCVIKRFYENKCKMASNRNDILVALALKNQLYAAVLLKKKQSKRRVWVRRLWEARERQGHYSNLITEMRL